MKIQKPYELAFSSSHFPMRAPFQMFFHRNSQDINSYLVLIKEQNVPFAEQHVSVVIGTVQSQFFISSELPYRFTELFPFLRMEV
jgi:hypothetical protein